MLSLRGKVLLTCLFFLPSTIAAADKIRVTFLNPSTIDNDFWSTATNFMKAAEDDLGFEIKVHYANQNRLKLKRMIEKDIASNEKPHYLVMNYIRGGNSAQVLKLAQDEGIKTFVFNTDVPEEERKRVGTPREVFSNWIGHIYPDDVQAGYDLASILIKKAREGNLQNPQGKIEVVGVSGNHQSPAAIFRNTGLESATKDSGNELQQVVFAKWKRDDASKKAGYLMKRYPNASVFWSASDSMSLGIIAGVKSSGKNPAKHILTGGIDWMPDALEAIKAGEMTASLGGHFMEAGWVMVMLYDYHHGKDFAKSEGLSIQSKMNVIHKDNVSAYLKHFGDRNWDKIDFKKFSKVLNPKLKKYDQKFPQSSTILNSSSI
ncbi:MAG: ABC transporter substrate-binding protein [Oligoflexales bacterium]|nr:ABC transporter substrate-binding protein [Oligoflexales bacterium]